MLDQASTNFIARPAREFDAIVVGAGFAGLYALHRLREMGLSVRVFEQGDGVGGTWYWNRYPGVRCDIESVDYSYSFSEELEQEWEWSERYPTGPEILRYLNHVADRFDLRRDIQLSTRVTEAHYDEVERALAGRDRGRGAVLGEVLRDGVRMPVVGEPPRLRRPRRVRGRLVPHGALAAGRRRARRQARRRDRHRLDRDPADPAARQAGGAPVRLPAHGQLQHARAQRAARSGAPAGGQGRLPRAAPARPGVAQRRSALASDAVPQRSALEVTPAGARAIFERGWAEGGIGGVLLAFNDINTNAEANDTAAEFVRSKIRQTVQDPATAEALCPTTIRSAPSASASTSTTTRPTTATTSRSSTSASDPIAAITRRGIRTTSRDYELDVIVFATGFDAITGALLEHRHPRPRWPAAEATSGRTARGPTSGSRRPGFPNMFLVTGPGSPSVLSNMVCSIEQHVDWIADCIGYLREHELETIEATPDAEDGWVAHVAEVAEATLFPLANSWYVGANIPGKPRVFMPYLGGVGNYRTHCDERRRNGYEGFSVDRQLAGARS